MRKKINNILTAFILTVVLLLTSACSDTKTIYSSGDLIDHTLEQRQAEEERIRATYKVDLDRHYGNGLYFEDFSLEREMFNEMYSRYVEKSLEVESSFPLIADANVEIYNDSLKKVQEGQLSLNEVLASPSEHFRKVYIDLYAFYKPEQKVSDEEEALFELIKTFWSESKENAPTIINWRNYDEKNLKMISLEEMKKIDNLFLEVNREDLILNIIYPNAEHAYYFTNKEMSAEFYQKDYQRLEEKYQTEMIYLGEWFNRPKYYAPVDNLNLKFAEGGTSDKLLSVLAQKHLYDEVDKIIKEEGGENFILQFSAPNPLNDSSMSDKPVNYNEKIDGIQFLTHVYENDYDINLICVNQPNMEIDKAVLQRICTRIFDFLDTEEEDGAERISLLVDFYTLNTRQEFMLLKELFWKDRLTENHFTYHHGIENMYSNMYIRRADTDGFHYLDIYGVKEDYMFLVSPSNLNREVNDWFENGKQKSEFE